MESLKLTPEEIQNIALTEDDIAEFEQTATVGLMPDEHLEYETHFKWLCDTRLKEYTAEAQIQKLQSMTPEEVVEQIARWLYEHDIVSTKWKDSKDKEWYLNEVRTTFPFKVVEREKIKKIIDYFGENIAYWEDELAQYTNPDDCLKWRKLKSELLADELTREDRDGKS